MTALAIILTILAIVFIITHLRKSDDAYKKGDIANAVYHILYAIFYALLFF